MFQREEQERVPSHSKRGRARGRITMLCLNAYGALFTVRQRLADASSVRRLSECNVPHCHMMEKNKSVPYY